MKRKDLIKFILLFMLISLLVGCIGTKRDNCPLFPVPSEHVQDVFDKLAEEDRQVWHWGNELLRLRDALGANGDEEE